MSAKLKILASWPPGKPGYCEDVQNVLFLKHGKFSVGGTEYATYFIYAQDDEVYWVTFGSTRTRRAL